MLEIPKGSQNEYDKDKNVLDRVLFSPLHYPEIMGLYLEHLQRMETL